MTTLARRNSSIHKIRQYSLKQATLEDEYEIIREIQENCRSRLLLVEHRKTRNEVVLKAIDKDSTKKDDFFREFHYNYYLSPHPNISNAYDVAFESHGYFMFAQEYAPFGDVTSNFSEQGIGEVNTKKVVVQVASALEFMHSKDLVHRDINMDNILVFTLDFSDVKLCDFGETRKERTFLKKKDVWLPYSPPETVDTVQSCGYYVDRKQDIWQFGMLMYVLLTGTLPWQRADIIDPLYTDYLSWKSKKSLKVPKRFLNFTTRFLRILKRFLEPKMDKRAEIKEIYKIIDQKWLVKQIKKPEKEIDCQSICYSTFSVHSSKKDKDAVLGILKDHGIETTVNRSDKRERIQEWIKRTIPDDLQQEAPLQHPQQLSLLIRPTRPKSYKDFDTPSNFNSLSIREQSNERKRSFGQLPLEQREYKSSIKEKTVQIPRNKKEPSVGIDIQYDAIQNAPKSSPSHGTTSHQLFNMYMQDMEIPPRQTLYDNQSYADTLYQSHSKEKLSAKPPIFEPTVPKRTRQGRTPGRSHSARKEKEQIKYRSRSLARDLFGDYDLHRSKTDPNVDQNERKRPTSVSDDDSLTDISP